MCWMGTETRVDGLNKEMLPEEFKKFHQTKTHSLKRVILYCFYKKPMSNRTSSRVESAMPETMEIFMMSQEIQRRMRNSSRDLPWVS